MIYSIICGVVMLVMLFIDQITKIWAAATNVNMTFIPGFMRFDYTTNPGMAFGMLSENPLAMKFVTALTVVMIVGIAVMFFTLFKGNKPVKMALAVIEAGAIGNLIDRLMMGEVRDFVDVSSIGFGNCNIADFCVTFGAVALIFFILFIGKDAMFPITKKWREEAKALAEEREQVKENGTEN